MKKKNLARMIILPPLYLLITFYLVSVIFVLLYGTWLDFLTLAFPLFASMVGKLVYWCGYHWTDEESL
jgi:hypothetical protein